MPFKDKEKARAYDKNRDRKAYDKYRYYNNEKRRASVKVAATASQARLKSRTTPQERTELGRHRPCRSFLARRNERLKRRYGLTLEQWKAMFEAQGQCCAICKATHSGWKHGWHTDHDHRTNQLRAILCHLCNRTLGYLNDDISWFQAFIDYLRRHEGSTAFP